MSRALRRQFVGLRPPTRCESLTEIPHRLSAYHPWAARFRTADSLLFICVAISAALVPDKARTRMRSSSYGVQTRPADFISLSPSARARPVEPHRSTADPAFREA